MVQANTSYGYDIVVSSSSYSKIEVECGGVIEFICIMALRGPFRVEASIFFLLLLWLPLDGVKANELRFNYKGEFKILQVADMHFGSGESPCLNTMPPAPVSPDQFNTTFCSNPNQTLFDLLSRMHFITPTPGCSDANTTDFLRRIIAAENPDLIVFMGDNIYGPDAPDAIASMNAAFSPAIESGIPWAAILGNHDQESTLNREEVMTYIATMNNTVSRVNPKPRNVSDSNVVGVDGFGNYDLNVLGVRHSDLENKSVLNLYMVDSGDYSQDPQVFGFDWIKVSQSEWLQEVSAQLKIEYTSPPAAQVDAAPALAFFHIPIPETQTVNFSNIVGDYQDVIKSPCVDSGFLSALLSIGDVKATFIGHDHVNDFCGTKFGIPICYGGGFGYHGYGFYGWPRRSRVVVASLDATEYGHSNISAWGDVAQIQTWKRLDDANMSLIDFEILWSK